MIGVAGIVGLSEGTGFGRMCFRLGVAGIDCEYAGFSEGTGFGRISFWCS